MLTLLHIDSSCDLTDSRSRKLTYAFAEAWRSSGADTTVLYRDLHQDPLPHLPDSWLHWPARLRPEIASPPVAAERLQTELITELVSADVVLIGAPMYNYSLPSTLKAWLDYIHVPGVTAAYDGNEMPMAGRTAVVINTRGAIYDVGTPSENWDHGTPVLDLVLGTGLGMTMEVIIASRTLANFVPMLSDERARGEEEFDSALQRLTELATATIETLRAMEGMDTHG